MARGEDEAVAVDPQRIGGIEAEELGPKDERHVGGAHRRPRMARLRALHGVDREELDRVDAKLLDIHGNGGHQTLRRAPNEVADAESGQRNPVTGVSYSDLLFIPTDRGAIEWPTESESHSPTAPPPPPLPPLSPSPQRGA